MTRFSWPFGVIGDFMIMLVKRKPTSLPILSRHSAVFAVRLGKYIRNAFVVMSAACAQAELSQALPQAELTSVIEEARRQIDLGLTKKTQATIQKHLNQLSQDSPLSSGYHQLTSLRAETLLVSKDYAAAMSWAKTSHTYLQLHIIQGSPLISERQDTLILMAHVHEALGQLTQATQCLNDALDLDMIDPRPDPLWELGVLTSLARVLSHSGQKKERGRIVDRIERKVQTLRNEYDQHRLGLDAYHRGVESLVPFFVDMGQHSVALEKWRELLRMYRPPSFRKTAGGSLPQVEILSELARLHRSRGQYIDELKTLNEALDIQTVLIGKEAGTDSIPRMTTLNKAEHRIRIADLHRRIGRTLDDVSGSSEHLMAFNRGALQSSLISKLDGFELKGAVVSSAPAKVLANRFLTAANNSYTRSRIELGTLIQTTDLGPAETDRATALSIVSLRGLQTVGNLLAEIARRGDECGTMAATATVIELTEELHAAFNAQLLENDPRIFEVKTFLGEQYVRQAHFCRAIAYLDEAHCFWSKRIPTRSKILVQTLLHLAEAVDHCEDGRSAGGAEAHAVRALQICKNDLADDPLIVTTGVKLGRLLARNGKYTEAESRLVEARQRVQGLHESRALGLVALDSLGALQSTLLRFADAVNSYSELVSLAGDLVSDGRDLLSDYIKLVNASLAREAVGVTSNRDLSKSYKGLRQIQSRIDEAKRLLEERNLPEDDPRALEIAHQQALLHFLRNQVEANPEERAKAGSHWRTILQAQTKKEDSGNVARTLYYLGRLRYADWASEFEDWRERYQQPLLQRLDYGERLKSYESRHRQYQHDLKDYEDKKLGYEGKLASATRRSLQADYDALWLAKYELDEERKSLARLNVSLNEQLRREEASAENAGRLRIRLAQVLSESELFALSAVNELRKLDNPTLNYLALCSHAQVNYAQSVFNQEEFAGGDSPLEVRAAKFASALKTAQLAAKLADDMLEADRVSTRRRELGRFIEPLEFFPRNTTAYDLLILLNRECGRLDVASQYETRRSEVISLQRNRH